MQVVNITESVHCKHISGCLTKRYFVRVSHR